MATLSWQKRRIDNAGRRAEREDGGGDGRISGEEDILIEISIHGVAGVWRRKLKANRNRNNNISVWHQLIILMAWRINQRGEKHVEANGHHSPGISGIKHSEQHRLWRAWRK